MEFDFEDVWERIRQVTGWKRYGDLAEFLSITSASVSGAKSRGVMPIEWAFRVASHYNINTDWLLTGEGSKAKDKEKYDKELLIMAINFLEKAFESFGSNIRWDKKGEFVIDFYEHLEKYNINKNQVNLIEKEALDIVKSLSLD